MSLDSLLPYLNLIITIVIISLAGLLQNVTGRMLKRMAIKFNFDENRRKVTSKIISLAIFILAAVIIFGLWGVDQDKVALYVTSIITILGVAFFAQWSHLSNISAGVILYFNHPLRIGDTVTFKNDSNPIQGRIADIGLFFTTLKTPEGERILIPNSNFIQSIVSVSESTTDNHSEQDEETPIPAEVLQ